MYISKRDYAVIKMFPELSKEDMETYLILRWNEWEYLKKNRANVKRNDFYIEEQHLTFDQAEEISKGSGSGAMDMKDRELIRMSTMNFYRCLYISELKRQERIAKISAFRKIANLPISGKVLYKRKFDEYQYNTDKFILDYNY